MSLIDTPHTTWHLWEEGKQSGRRRGSGEDRLGECLQSYRCKCAIATHRLISVQNIKFVKVSNEQASGHGAKKHGGLSGISISSDVYIHRLIISKDQRDNIDKLYRCGKIFDRVFDNTEQSQIEAVSMAVAHELDEVSRDALSSRWSIRWTNGSAEDTGVNSIYRVLYQW